MRKFLDKYQFGAPFYHIHPHKQQQVKHLTQHMPSWVTHLIIFGSAVHSWHYDDKDLDVCIVGENPHQGEDDFSYRKPMKMPGCRYDFVEFATFEELEACRGEVNSIGHDILTEGVLVYEKSRSISCKVRCLSKISNIKNLNFFQKRGCIYFNSVVYLIHKETGHPPYLFLFFWRCTQAVEEVRLESV